MEARGVVKREVRVAAVAGALLLAAAAAILISDRNSSSASLQWPTARTTYITCQSPALGGTLPTAVYLPAGYAPQRPTHYPVVYFLHGLPAGPDTYKTNSFVAHAIAASGHRALVVAPQGARTSGSDREYLNWSPKDNWPGAIAGDLVKCIDKRYATIRDRKARALIGLSAGGYGAFNIGLRRLATFTAVESWSGYFAATDPSGLVTLNLGSTRANRKARVPRGNRLSDRLKRFPTFIAFYVGNQDNTFLNANVIMNRTLDSHGIPHTFRIYSGGHSTSLWERWAPTWLGWALERMARPT